MQRIWERVGTQPSGWWLKPKPTFWELSLEGRGPWSSAALLPRL